MLLKTEKNDIPVSEREQYTIKLNPALRQGLPASMHVCIGAVRQVSGRLHDLAKGSNEKNGGDKTSSQTHGKLKFCL